MEFMLYHYRHSAGYALWKYVEGEQGRPALEWVDYTRNDDLAEALVEFGIDGLQLNPLPASTLGLASATYSAGWDVQSKAA